MIVAALVLGAVVAGAASPDKVAQLSEAMATDACADGTCALHALQQNISALPANNTKQKSDPANPPPKAEKQEEQEDKDPFDPEGDLLGADNFAATKVALLAGPKAETRFGAVAEASKMSTVAMLATTTTACTQLMHAAAAATAP
ncbi:unnamed protein product [Symbiodinium sp. CCMP2592]|nr:unnamed protein product [Symbiodinium sp. CCMP2592]